MQADVTRTHVNPALQPEASQAERRARGRHKLAALTVICHPDPRRVGERALLTGLASGRPARISRLEPPFAQPTEDRFRPLGDHYLSRTPISLTATKEGAILVDTSQTRTLVQAEGEVLAGGKHFSVSELNRGVILELASRVVLVLHLIEQPEDSEFEGFDLVGASDAMLRVRREIQQVADLEVPVLLRGETGTGKELVANAIHRSSRRSDDICMSVNLGAIPVTLAASELFGAVKGAFTGADRNRAGYFQQASGGTLFLDEVGEASPEVQVMLLRALETGEVQRVGALEPQKVDVRLIAATDADLEAAISDGRFRAPLLHRLAGYEIGLPPLRDRRDDFGRLLYHFLRLELRETGEEFRLTPEDPAAEPWLPASIVARLARHPWPGNVRQLRNAARQLAIASRGSAVVKVGPQIERLLLEAVDPSESTSVGLQKLQSSGSLPRRRRAPKAVYRKPSDVTEEELIAALRSNLWEIKPSADALGISRSSLYMLIDKNPNIRKASEISEDELATCLEACNANLQEMARRLEVSSSGLQQRLKKLGLV